MFRYERMPSDLTYRSNAWYVVDHDRDVWLEDLGTNGPRGDRVFALCIRGSRIPFEVDPSVEVDGARAHQITSFGTSHTAAFTHGIGEYAFSDRDEVLAMEELAAEAVLALLAARGATFGWSPDDLVQLGTGGRPVHQLVDFGYPDGVPTDGEIS